VLDGAAGVEIANYKLPITNRCGLQTNMSIKAKIEAIVYAAEEPVTLEQIFSLVKEEVRQQMARERSAEAEPEAMDDPESPATAIPVQEDTGTPAGETEAQPGSSDAVGTPVEVEPAEEATQISAGVDAPEAAEPKRGATVGAETEATEPVTDAEIAADLAPEAEVLAEQTPIIDAEVKSAVRAALEELIADYAKPEHGIEVRQVAGGYRMATKPEQHDAVRTFAKSLKPPIRLSLQALETLAVIAYKQPVTAPEISEIRGVDTGGVVGTLLDRKLVTTAGRKQVIGRPILYKTTREFLLRFGLKDLDELPSVEEFEKLAAESLGADLFTAAPEAAPAAESAAAAAEDGSENAPAAAEDGSEPEGTKEAAPSSAEPPSAEAPAALTDEKESGSSE
jgi:segregation and condensation protein B